jgi:hypothetical protein
MATHILQTAFESAHMFITGQALPQTAVSAAQGWCLGFTLATHRIHVADVAVAHRGAIRPHVHAVQCRVVPLKAQPVEGAKHAGAGDVAKVGLNLQAIPACSPSSEGSQ